MAKTAAQYEE
jgi:hypothetical protein